MYPYMEKIFSIQMSIDKLLPSSRYVMTCAVSAKGSCRLFISESANLGSSYQKSAASLILGTHKILVYLPFHPSLVVNLSKYSFTYYDMHTNWTASWLQARMNSVMMRMLMSLVTALRLVSYLVTNSRFVLCVMTIYEVQSPSACSQGTTFISCSCIVLYCIVGSLQ